MNKEQKQGLRILWFKRAFLGLAFTASLGYGVTKIPVVRHELDKQTQVQEYRREHAKFTSLSEQLLKLLTSRDQMQFQRYWESMELDIGDTENSQVLLQDLILFLESNPETPNHLGFYEELGPYDKENALSSIATVIGQISDVDEADQLLQQILKSAESMQSSEAKVETLTSISDAYIQLSDMHAAEQVLRQALQNTESIQHSEDDDNQWELRWIAEAYGRLYSSSSDKKHLQQALSVTDSIQIASFKAEVLVFIVETLYEKSEQDIANQIIQKAITAAEANQSLTRRVESLVLIAEAVGETSNKDAALLILQKAVIATESKKDSYKGKVYALRIIAESAIQLSNEDTGAVLLKKAIVIANELGEDSYQSYAESLSQIAQIAGQLSDEDTAASLIRKTITGAGKIQDAHYRSWPLIGISEAISQLSDVDTAKKLLENTTIVAESVQGSNYTSMSLGAIAEAYGQLYSTDPDPNLLQQALTITESIQDPARKADALFSIAEGIGPFSDVDEVAKLTQQVTAVTGRLEKLYVRDDDIVALLSSMALAYERRSDRDAAEQLLQQASTITESSSSSSKVKASLQLVKAYRQLSNADESERFLQLAITTTESMGHEANNLLDLIAEVDSLAEVDALGPILLPWAALYQDFGSQESPEVPTMRVYVWEEILSLSFLIFLSLSLFWLLLQQRTRISFTGQLLVVFPEECVAELAALQRQMKETGKPAWYIKLRLYQEVLELALGLCITTNLDNLWILKSRRHIDDD